MKFQVPRDVFAEAVQWTARAVPQRVAIPILAAVKIQASDQLVQLSSYDYEISAHASIEANMDEGGEVLVPGRLLSDICKAFPKQPVTFETKENQVELTCGNSHFVLPTMPLDDYPRLPELPQLRGTLDAREFANAISQVAIAASGDETLAMLTGIKLEIKGNQIRLLATDRYRLACRELEWQPVDPEFEVELLVKAQILVDISKSMTSTGQIHMMVSDPDQTGSILVGFECEGRKATSSLMDGEYPQVLRLFPEQTPIQMTCRRQELLDAVNRMALVVENKTPVRLNFEKDNLRLEAGQGNTAQAEELVPITGSAEEFLAAFNPDFLRAGLGALKSDYINFGFSDPSKAVVITGKDEPEAESDQSFRYLLMPIRVGV